MTLFRRDCGAMVIESVGICSRVQGESAVGGSLRFGILCPWVSIKISEVLLQCPEGDSRYTIPLCNFPLCIVGLALGLALDHGKTCPALFSDGSGKTGSHQKK